MEGEKKPIQVEEEHAKTNIKSPQSSGSNPEPRCCETTYTVPRQIKYICEWSPFLELSVHFPTLSVTAVLQVSSPTKKLRGMFSMEEK